MIGFIFLMLIGPLAVLLVMFFYLYGVPDVRQFPNILIKKWAGREIRRTAREYEEEVQRKEEVAKAKEEEQERYEAAQMKLYNLERGEILKDIRRTKTLRERRREFQHSMMDVWERELAFLEGKISQDEYLQLKYAEDLRYGAIEDAKQKGMEQGYQDRLRREYNVGIRQAYTIPPPGPSSRTIDSFKPLPSQLIAIVSRIQDRNGDFPGGGFKTDKKRLEQLAFREKAMMAVKHYEQGHTTARETLYHIHQIADSFGYR